MSTVTPFPGRVRAVGESFPAETLRAGMSAAERLGISRESLDAMLAHDRPTATHLLCFLASPDPHEQRCGAVGLSRLLASMEQEHVA